MTKAARWGPRLAAAAALALAGAACRPAHGNEPAAADKKEEKKEGFGKLSMDDVQAAIAKGDSAIFDNNSKKQWAEGHVPSAKWVDYKNLNAEDLPQDKGKQLIFYCSNEH